jgi:hypothetical protein
VCLVEMDELVFCLPEKKWMSMYTGPILPPAATSAPGTYLAGVSLYSWIVLVQLNHANLRHRTATAY